MTGVLGRQFEPRLSTSTEPEDNPRVSAPMRRLQLALLLLGVGLLVLLIRRVGAASIVAGLTEVGWAFAAIFAIEMAIDAMHTAGWARCFPIDARLLPKLDLFLVRTAGVAVNVLTPTASLGGEVVKGILARRWVPLTDAFASVMVDKLTYALGQAVFLVVGLVAVLRIVPLAARERWIATAGALLWLAAVGAFFVMQRRGIFGSGVSALRTLFGGSAMLERLPGHAEAFDRRVVGFLSSHHREFAASVGWHTAGQAARTLQFFLVFAALGLEPTLGNCVTAASGLVFMEATLFLFPGKVGVLEGGYLLLFSALGFDSATALTVAFTFRLSELGSAMVGLAALGWYHFRGEDTGGARPADSSPGEEGGLSPPTRSGT
jgi:glycosyltransferase 2 family protein